MTGFDYFILALIMPVNTLNLYCLNTLRMRQDGCHFVDDIFKCIFVNENIWISLKISLRSVPKIWINNILALVKIMPWRWPGNKPSFEPMMVRLLMHICIALPQWVEIILPLVFSNIIIKGCQLHIIPRDLKAVGILGFIIPGDLKGCCWYSRLHHSRRSQRLMVF